MQRVFCPTCTKELWSSATYCPQCGTAVSDPDIPADVDGSYGEGFGHCGHEAHLIQSARRNARFCAGCGEDLATQTVTQSTAQRPNPFDPILLGMIRLANS